MAAGWLLQVSAEGAGWGLAAGWQRLLGFDAGLEEVRERLWVQDGVGLAGE